MIPRLTLQAPFAGEGTTNAWFSDPTITSTNAATQAFLIRDDRVDLFRRHLAHDRDAARELASVNYPFRLRPRADAVLVGYPEHRWYEPVEAWALGGTTGRLYAIGKNVWQLDGLGRVARRTCWETVWEAGAPVHRADKVWAMRLAIEFDEARVLKDLPWSEGG